MVKKMTNPPESIVETLEKVNRASCKHFEALHAKLDAQYVLLDVEVMAKRQLDKAAAAHHQADQFDAMSNILSMPWMNTSLVRGNVAFMIKYCFDKPVYDLYYIPLVSRTCGYDLCDKPEEPKHMRNSSCGSERPVGDYERSPGIVRVMLKRLLGNLNIYGNHYDMMRQSPFAHKQFDDVTGVKLEKWNI